MKSQLSKRVSYFIMVGLMSSLLFFQGCSKKDSWPWENENTEENHLFFTLEKEAENVTSYDFYTQSEFYSDIMDQPFTLTENFSSSQQEQFMDMIAGLHQVSNYSLMYPLMIQNPFGTNTRSLYINFGPMKQPVSIQYTISVEDIRYPDYSKHVYVNPKREWIEGQITGLIPGYRNLLVIKIVDFEGKELANHIYSLDIPQAIYPVDMFLESSVFNEQDMTQGLFCIMTVYEGGRSYCLYDQYGVLRAELPIESSAPALKLLCIQNELFYPVSEDIFIRVESTGKVLGWYENLMDTIIDYDYDKKNNRIHLLQKDGVIYELNLEGEHVMEASQRRNFSDEDITFQNLYCIDGEDLVLFSKEKDSILRMNKSTKKLVVRWIIGSEDIWTEHGLASDLLYSKGEGPTKMQSIQIAESKGLKSGQLYLSTLVQKNNQDRTGLYYEGYIVDENNNSYRRIEEQFLTNNKEKAVLVHYGEHFLICYENGIIEEYKKNGELLCRFSQSQEVLPESFCKYTMARIWF